MTMEALREMEDRAIREKERMTYNSTLGSISAFLVVTLGLLLPSPWKVINGEWSPRMLPSLVMLGAHVVLAVSVLISARCAKVLGADVWEQFSSRTLRSKEPTAALSTAPVDRLAALHDVVNLKNLPSLSPLMKDVRSTSAVGSKTQRSFFDPAPVTTVEQGRAYLSHLQEAARERENDTAAPTNAMSSFGGGASYGIYGTAGLMPRVYQACGFDPYLEDASLGKEQDALTTTSNPKVAWAQLEDAGLAMFMHLYVRNIRRLLACHVKDFVEAFVQNALELNECGVMADLLLRRVPSQALLCPPGQAQQMTNVSLQDLVHGLKRHPSFVSKTRDVFLLEEHLTFEKYLNVGDPTSTEFSSLERQQYVLERLILLSKDRNLDRFRWDKGSSWRGKDWVESLPTDSEILMNVFSCILDNMLPAENERDRPFWKSYFLAKPPRRPFNTRMRNRLYFVQTVQRPPHFKILAKAAVKEIVPCEENPFHAVIVYLHAVKKLKAGYLDSINLHRLIEQVFDVSK